MVAYDIIDPGQRNIYLLWFRIYGFVYLITGIQKHSNCCQQTVSSVICVGKVLEDRWGMSPTTILNVASLSSSRPLSCMKGRYGAF